MQSKSVVEIADRVSRKRAGGIAVAAIAFLIVQIVTRPFFAGGREVVSHLRRDLWAVNAVVLLLLLATGGALLYHRQIRALVNDEVALGNYKTAVVAGYWVAMTTAMGLYVVPTFSSFTVRETVYVIVTLSITVALLAFSYLEYRDHRDA
jgi:hypothetical protein